MADEETPINEQKEEEIKPEDTSNKIEAEENNVKDSPSKIKEVEDEGKANGEEMDTKSEEDEDNDEDDDDDEDEEEEVLPPGLLEQPLEVEGKRQKKKVERLSASMVVTPTEKPQLDIAEGRGTKLGDIPYVSHYINVTKASDLKPLHRFLFFRLGTLNDIKKNIRKFSGFTEDTDSKEREKRVAIATKMSTTDLKNISQWLGLKQSGSKKEVVERILEYLESPSDQGIEPKKRGSKAKAVAKKGTKRKRKTVKKEKPKKKKPAKKSEKDSEEEDEEEEEEQEDDDDEEQQDDEDAEEEDESEDEAPKKKKRKVEVKKKEKATPKKPAKENGKKEKATPKKEKATPKKEKATPKKEKKTPKKETKKKATPKKKPAAEELSDLSGDDDDSDSDNETLIQAIKPPSDDEIKKSVKSILEGADLETVTMKTVVKQIYAKYPKFDLSDRKDFIKSTVREVIS